MDSGNIHSLMALADFKAVLGIDDREDKLARFCLITATHTIEQYCKRRLLRKKHFERIEFYGDLIIPLREYPIIDVLIVYALTNNDRVGEIVEPELYNVIPDCGTNEDIPFNLSLSPAMQKYRGLSALKAVYRAGYVQGKAPPDLVSACLELAAWNFNRYKGRRIGVTGNIKGAGIQGEHFELSMPENVKVLLEPYRRRVI